ncbi:MAG: hypothetical protein WBB28_01440 [Crinalium sp.]
MQQDNCQATQISEPVLDKKLRYCLEWALYLSAHGNQNQSYRYARYLSVCSSVLEQDGTESDAIAAICCEVFCDSLVDLAEIEEKFGEDVAEVVTYLHPDQYLQPQEKWTKTYLYLIENAVESSCAESIAMVSAACMLYKLRCQLGDITRINLSWIDFYDGLIQSYCNYLDPTNKTMRELKTIFEDRLKPYGKHLLKQELAEVFQSSSFPKKPRWIDDSIEMSNGDWLIVADKSSK